MEVSILWDIRIKEVRLYTSSISVSRYNGPKASSSSIMGQGELSRKRTLFYGRMLQLSGDSTIVYPSLSIIAPW